MTLSYQTSPACNQVDTEVVVGRCALSNYRVVQNLSNLSASFIQDFKVTVNVCKLAKVYTHSCDIVHVYCKDIKYIEYTANL